MEVEVTETTPEAEMSEAAIAVAAVSAGAAIAQEAQRQASLEAQQQTWDGQAAMESLAGEMRAGFSQMDGRMTTLESQVTSLGAATAIALAESEDENQGSQDDTNETVSANDAEPERIAVPATMESDASEARPKRKAGPVATFLRRARIL